MVQLLNLFLCLPIAGFIVSLLFPKKAEVAISGFTYILLGIHLLTFIAILFQWIFTSAKSVEINSIILYKTKEYEFLLYFYFDKVAVVYLGVGTFLAFLISIYSGYYLHLEEGYKRFFNTILFFYSGYTIAILSGNFETLIVGWEILGISSFLLIGFYRNRYLPVKNAVKVFSLYRVGDIGLLLAMWMSHQLWHENVTFLKLNNAQLVHEHLQSHTSTGVFISLMILLAASIKSAQFPFSTWLPRAMEGPTPSSAIFYGSLAVHMGVFLLLRTHTFWEYQAFVRILFASIGVITTIIATGTARVQSSVKGQIAYSSIAQIGLIFIEVSLGFYNLALLHFAGNAFLRTYQLLVSPSVVAYQIRQQFYFFKPRKKITKYSLPQKLVYTFYVLCLQEWYLDTIMYRYLWNPLKFVGMKLDFLTLNRILFVSIPVYLAGVYCAYHKVILPLGIIKYLPFTFSLIGMISVLKAFTERIRVKLSWFLTVMSHFWIALAVAFNENFKFGQVYIYLSGVIVAATLGWLVLRRLRILEQSIDLDMFHGHVYKHPKLAMLFLLCCLGISGFPITPTFIGEDLMFMHVGETQGLLALMLASIFIINGISVIRIYARIFLGPHAKSPDQMPYQST